jgi:EAL domain-containing protein (putative c-di-GMP-specific phosphodiesterase class I)
MATMRHVRLTEDGELPTSRPYVLASSIDCVERALGSVRSHLGMDVAFVSEFVGEERIFRHVNSKIGKSPVRVGDSVSLDKGYCKKVVDGRLPELIPDTSVVPEAMAIPETSDVPIGSHISVPLLLGDGTVYGTFCCFSFVPDLSLSERDLKIMKAFADIIAYQIDVNLKNVHEQTEKVSRIQSILRTEAPAMVYQPVFRLSDMRVLGAEALARFEVAPYRSPDKWFAEACEAGLRTELELKAIRNALSQIKAVANSASFYLAINSSPQTIMNEGFWQTIACFPPGRLILEITEHDHVENYDDLIRSLSALRTQGLKIAIDDAGSGYASMRHILNVHPDFIKLDVSLTRGIDADKMKRALARALIEFGRETECKIVAEGVESEAEMKALRALGVHAAQGYLLSRPVSCRGLERLLHESNHRADSMSAPDIASFRSLLSRESTRH